MRRKGSCHVSFIVKAIIRFIDSAHIPSIIPGLILAIFCVRYPHAMLFLKKNLGFNLS